MTRGVRFFLVAALLWKFGEPIRAFIEKRLTLLTWLFLIALVGGFVAFRYIFWVACMTLANVFPSPASSACSPRWAAARCWAAPTTSSTWSASPPATCAAGSAGRTWWRSRSGC